MDTTIGALGIVLAKLHVLYFKIPIENRVRKSIRSLQAELELMRAILKVVRVPSEQIVDGVKIWAGMVRELSYRLVDIVDAFMLHVDDGGDFTNPKNRVRKLLKKTIKLFKGKDLHWNALEEVVGQAKQLLKLHQRYEEVIPDTSVGARVDPREMALCKDVTELIGIEDSRNKLVSMLIEGDDWSKHPSKTICIVGFAGLGKTTLAKTVYDEIKGQFDCAAFVSVCQNPNMNKVVQNILYGLDKNKYADNNQKAQDEKELIDELIEFLNGKRYLIVIDDIWDKEVWDLIKCAFPGRNSLGSRIITTTRIVSLSEACCSSSDDIYQMEPLSDDYSRKLLFDRMFGSVRRCPREFEQVSSDILMKCAGVPLAIIAMASILAGDLWMKPKDELHLLLKSVGQGLRNECWENMQRILSSSYYDLPFYLRTSLLYLSTFPVTQPIERERLMKKLIVEGIIFTSEEGVSIEDLSSLYLNEFANRNVIHPLECNNDGEVISYHIHPMMHEILKAIAMEEKFADSLDNMDISSAHSVNFRHLSIDCPDSESLINISSMAFDCRAHSLTVFGHVNRSLLSHCEGMQLLDLEGCKSISRADLEYICNMVLLKQLWLTNTEITKLPPQIGNLQYLEGLNVGGTQITELPPQVFKLQRLKTLDARKSRVKDLPDQVVRLTRLVHLLIGDNESCEGVKLPDGFGKMKSLQQLGTIDLRTCSASSTKELVDLRYLKEIAVLLSNEPEDARMNDALLSSLSSTNMTSLVVCSDFRLSTLQYTSYNLNCRKKLTVVRRSLKVPDGIAGNHHLILRMLDIRVCKLEEDDLKILRELPRLQSLIVRLEVLPTKMIRISHEGFAKLESFQVDCRLPMVVFEEGAMPKLEHLELKLYGGTASEEHMGIKYLLNLRKVTLRYSKWYAVNKGVRETSEAVKTEDMEHENKEVEETTDAVKTGAKGHRKKGIKETIGAVRTEAKEHQNKITLCIVEEGKDGECVMKTEIFEENKDASYSKMTEIEEDGHADTTAYFLNGRDNTQEGDLHQSSRDVAGCTGASEIEEVVA